MIIANIPQPKEFVKYFTIIPRTLINDSDIPDKLRCIGTYFVLKSTRYAGYSLNALCSLSKVRHYGLRVYARELHKRGYINAREKQWNMFGSEPSEYVKVENTILTYGLPLPVLGMYCVLKAYTHNGNSFVSIRTIATVCGISYATAKRYCSRLRQCGLLATTQRKASTKYSTNLYTFGSERYPQLSHGISPVEPRDIPN